MRILVFLLFGAVAWGQSSGRSLSNVAKNEQPTAGVASSTNTASSIAPDAPVLSIKGLCNDTGLGSAQSSECATSITRAQFETLVQFIQPDWSVAQRRQFASSYAEALVLAGQARQMGLDRGPRFESLMKMQKEFVLQYLLTQAIQERAAHVPDKDIEAYYKEHSESFDEIEYQRLYVPITQQLSETGLSTADAQKRRQVSFSLLKTTAEELHARAVKGEDFAHLQGEAYKAAGYGSAGDWPKLATERRRRHDLPSGETSLIDLRPGNISQIFDESNGRYICKVISRRTLPLSEVQAEISERLRTDRLQQFQREAHRTATPAFNESYFRLVADPSSQPNSEP